MKHLSCIIVFIFCFAFAPAFTQSGPTLQAGLNGITFTRGNLDAELIAEIIAEKQNELKTRLIKSMLLKSLGVDNGLFYTYIDNTIDIIANEKDEKTRVKNLLENTVNLAFVVAYTEYYLYTLKDSTPQIQHLRKLAFSYGIDSNKIRPGVGLQDIVKVDFKKNGEKIQIEQNLDKDMRNQFVGVLLDIVAEAVKKNSKLKTIGLLRTSYLQNQNATNAYYALTNETPGDGLEEVKDENNDFEKRYVALEKIIADKDFISLSDSVLADLIAANYSAVASERVAIEKNYKKLQTAYANLLALLETNPRYSALRAAFYFNQNYEIRRFKSRQIDSLFITNYGINPSTVNSAITNDTNAYKAWSSFYRTLDIEYKFNLFKEIFNRKPAADSIVADVGNNLNTLLKYYGMIKTLASKGTNLDTVWKVLKANYQCGNDSTLFSRIVATTDSARNDMHNLATLGKEDLDAFNNVNNFIEKLRLVEANRYEYLAEYESIIKHSLVRLSKYSQEYVVLQGLMYQRLLCYVTQAEADLNAIGLDLNNSFVNLLVSINEFDKPETFQKFLNQLSDAGDVFSNEKMRSSINRVITFVRSYIQVAENQANQPTVTIDVEGFITSLQRLNYNKFSPWQMHFTVGTNAAAFNRPLALSDGTTLNNYSFVGEKIGVKYKVWNGAYLSSFSRGETFTYWRKGIPFFGKTTYVRTAPPSEPVVSNVHLLAYGSGILYNLVNTGTTDNFNSPLVAVGLGATFYNGLDINLSFGTPILSNKPFLDKSVPFFFNLGMDIQFIEYINRLNKKRQENQTQNKLADAAKR